jgi:hypothetical protein
VRVSENPSSDCPRQVWVSPGIHSMLLTRGGRVRLMLLGVFLVVAVAVVGRIYGQHLAYQDMLARDSAIEQLERERQKLEIDKTDVNQQISSLESKLSRVQSALDTIIPSQDTYNIGPNQSLVVGGGHLTMGLVGTPTADGINLNLNGKQQQATVGDVIHLTADSSTTCTIKVQSFDMFKANITASCGLAKTQ